MRNTPLARAAARAFAAFTLAAAVLSTPAAAADVALTDLPKEAQATHALILQGGPFPYTKDGVTFGNFEGNLPQQRRGYYREYTVATPGVRHRGARRIVCGAEARQWTHHRPAMCWYTSDHYKSFQKIKA